MKFPNKYRCLTQNVFSNKGYSIVPIRYEDRIAIMTWRNEQVYHLRQSSFLTQEDQNSYFESTVIKLFENERPNQILFSYLKDNVCIGYGGLVHINWLDKNAEISFVMNTSLEKHEFKTHWVNYLRLIEKVAFNELNLHKIYTYAFDLRPRLYDSLETVGFKKEAVLEQHCFFEGKFKNVIIHSKVVPEALKLREINSLDSKLLFNWVNETAVRFNSINKSQISWDNHELWFQNQLNNSSSYIFVLEMNETPVGQIRFDLLNNKYEVDYSIDKKYRGKGFGTQIIEKAIYKNKKLKKGIEIIAKVNVSNLGSIKVFTKLGFKLLDEEIINDEEYKVFIKA